MVPPARTEKLINHITQDKEIVLIDQADHATIGMYPEYWSAFLRFINRQENEEALYLE